jgi:DNA-binding response OmpR family regulator
MRKTIVVAEDEILIAEAQKLILEDEYQVHLTHDGESAISKIKEVMPDIVILDLMLPKVNGIDICKQIRSNADLSHTKVVMVTAKNTRRDELEGMGVGADDYIMKPFEPIELLHVVRQVTKG